MRNFLILVITGLLLFSVTNCKKNTSESGKVLSKNQLKSLSNTGFPLPDGTVFSEVTDATGKVVRIDFRLPENACILGTTLTGERIKENTGSLTCTCDGSGGCKPFAAAGKMGCIIDDCTKCTGTTKAGLTLQELDFFFIQKGILRGMDELATLGNTRPAYSYEEWNAADFVSNEDISSQDFTDAIDDLNVYLSDFEKVDIVSMAFLIKGKRMLIDVPFASLTNGTLYSISNSSGGYKCSGSCGTKKCKLETAAMGQVSYCDGCQSGCTISAKK